MAVPPNRSPSPLSSRPIPHSRNLDCNSGPRRSFSGNPFHRPSVLTNPRSLNPVTPANSPAGFGRRNSLGREGTGNLQVCEEKENEKDQNLKPVKQRSPANGSKNFMSPTISAASKFTPPGKKILAERNDPVRTSISLSDGIATFCSAISSEMTEDPKSEKVLDQQKAGGNMESTVLECPRISKPLKRVTFSEVPSNSENGTESKPEKITVDSDFVGVDSNSKNTHSPFPMSPIIAPVDADPSLPPYDPKTNFRSPRPQFLHYKPNPRIEVLLKKEKGHDLGEAKRLEDSFMLEGSSETFSDTDGTEASYSEDSQKDSDDSSLAENVLPEGMEEEPIHSSCPISHDLSEGILEEKDEGNAILAQGVVEDKGEEKANIAHINHDMAEGIAYDIGETKPRFFTKLKCVSLLLVLLVAGISIWATNSPFMDSSVLNILKSSKLREPSEIAVLAKANIDGLGQRFKQLSFDSVSHLFLLINNLGGRAHLAPVQFMNLTDLQNDALGCGYLEDHHQSQKFAQNLEDDDFEEEEDAETEPLEEQTFAEAASEDRNKKEPEEESDLGTENEDFEEEEDAETEPLEASDLGTEELPLEAAQLADTNAPESSESPWNQEEASHIDPELRCKVDSEDDLTPEVQSEAIAYELHPKVIETKNLEGDMGLDSRIKVESLSADIDTKGTSDASSSTLEDRSSEKIESLVVGSENRYSAYAIMGIASLFLVLMLSALAFISLKPGHSDIQTVALDTRELSSKKMNLLSSVPDKIFQDGPSCHNWATEVEVEGESCPSEMSSFQKSSSYSRKNLKVANEAHSQERKPRKYSKRESLASSSEFSMGSPSSYGSFTTYERISSKHANGDDEITTPVRRSSRIRNLVTSP